MCMNPHCITLFCRGCSGKRGKPLTPPPPVHPVHPVIHLDSKAPIPPKAKGFLLMTCGWGTVWRSLSHHDTYDEAFEKGIITGLRDFDVVPY